MADVITSMLDLQSLYLVGWDWQPGTVGKDVPLPCIVARGRDPRHALEVARGTSVLRGARYGLFRICRSDHWLLDRYEDTILMVREHNVTHIVKADVSPFIKVVHMADVRI
jgi:hypothetical protein